MSGNLFFAIIVGFMVVVFVYAIYWTAVIKPRLRVQFTAKAEQHGWTYIPGKSIMVSRYSKGYLLSPQERIDDSLQGSTQGIKWGVDGMTVRSKTEERVRRPDGSFDTTSNSVHVVIWHTEDVRIEHGSVLLFVKPEGWGQSENVGAMLRTGVKAVYSSLINGMVRENFNIQNTPITLNISEFDAKYRIEVSDVGAAQVALTSEVRDFLIKHSPPAELIQLGDNALDLVVEDPTYFQKIEQFDKLVGLADYGVQLAQVVAASQNATAAQKPASPTL